MLLQEGSSSTPIRSLIVPTETWSFSKKTWSVGFFRESESKVTFLLSSSHVARDGFDFQLYLSSLGEVTWVFAFSFGGSFLNTE